MAHYAVAPKEVHSLITADGIRLDADVYRPIAPNEIFPVLLMRQPYGRAIASTVVYAHPRWYAAHGYIVVIQDVRGRGTSEGEFQLFASEIQDGEATVNWAAQLPGSNGTVGMYGFSYQGMTQIYAAIARPNALKTICPAMLAYDLYADWAYEGGAFCLETNLVWALQLATETARRKDDATAHLMLTSAAKKMPLQNIIPVRSGMLKSLAPDSFYHEWIEHPQPDEYWEKLSPKTYLSQLDLPMLHIGGWYDCYLRGTLALYQAMCDRSQYPQQLLVGPWAHLPWGRKVGALDFGPEAISPCDRLQIRWFDHWLKGIDTGLLDESPVQLFELGRNQWRSLPQWPNPQTIPYYFTSTGLAAMDERDGQLVPHLPTITSEDTWVHDPWRPVPSLGGHASLPAGPFERGGIDGRSDVLTYTSSPLTQELRVLGNAIAHLHVQSEATSFDLCIILSEVLPSGAIYPLAQGYCRVDHRSSDRVEVRLQPICAAIAIGHSLRISISAACFPAYAVNAGTGAVAGAARLIDQQVITITLMGGGDLASHILLPVHD